MGGPAPISNLGCCSDDELIEAGEELSRSLCSILKINTVKPTRDAEIRMARSITRAWKSAARAGIQKPLRRLLSGNITEIRIKRFSRQIGLALSEPLSARQIRIIEGRLRSIYRTAKRLGAKEAGGSFSFKQVDQRAVKALNRHQVFWVGNFYDEQLSDRIAAVSNDILIQQGLAQDEAAIVLRNAVHREMSLIPGGKTSFAEDVVARYAGNTDLYFRQVASTAAHHSRTIGKIRAYEEAEIVSYKLVNPDDRRTGTICQQMSGQVFSVQVGVGHAEQILDAEDPVEVKNVAPWLSGREIEHVLGGSRKGSQDAARKLEEVGAILPPFHSLCRTEPVVLS